MKAIYIGRCFDVRILDDPTLGYMQGYMANETYDYGYSHAPGFAGILAPTTADHRYFNEDVNALCLWEEMAKAFGTKHDAITTVINMASIVRNMDFRAKKTKSLSSLGLEGYTVGNLKDVL